MPNLILPSLEIQNFRVFEHLRIERLGRVNLITGKNNVGKTCLLEALYLYANKGTPHLIRNLLNSRDELRTSTSDIRLLTNPENTAVDMANVRHLFYGRPSIYDIVSPIVIGPIANKEQTVILNIEWRQLIEHQNSEGKISRAWEMIAPSDALSTSLIRPYMASYMGDQLSLREGLDGVLWATDSIYAKVQFVTNEYIKNNGLSNLYIATLWDKIVLSPLEEEVLTGLRIIAPNISRVSIIAESDDAREPVPIIVTREHSERLPLHSLGDGICRLFGIILALVNVQNGILLIDEVETGLHYSVMPEVWRLIFQVAERLNVQVFATTHSWDCIEAFEQAAREDEKAEAELIHLLYKHNQLFATLYDERELSIVTRELIEVR